MNPDSRSIYHGDALRFLECLDDALFTMIYLEPPWGTAISSTGDHAEYRALISKVAQQCWRLLNDKGTLYCHLPSVSDTDYRLIINQACGRLPSTVIIVDHAQAGNHGAGTPPKHGDVLRYTKSNTAVYNVERNAILDKRFNLVDQRGPYKLSDISIGVFRPNLIYSVGGCMPPPGRSWRFSQEQMNQYIADGRVLVVSDGMPRLKQYLGETLGEDIGSIWTDIPKNPRLPNSRFTTQPEFCRRIVAQATNEGDWLLDPFCRTGSMLIEAEILGRRWVGCESSEVAISAACEIFTNEPGLQGRTTPAVHDLSVDADQPLFQRYSEAFLSVDDLEIARRKLATFVSLLAAIKAERAASQMSDEQVIEDIFASLPKLSWLFSGDARRRCAVSMEKLMPAFLLLEEESQDFLVVSLLLLNTMPEDMDQSTISISAWKAIENELNVKFMFPFRDWFVREHSDLKQALLTDMEKGEANGWQARALASYLLHAKPPALGQTRAVVEKCVNSKKTVRVSPSLYAFKQYFSALGEEKSFFFADNGLLSTLSQKKIDTYRNGAAHTSIFTHQRARESFDFVVDALTKIISSWSDCRCVYVDNYKGKIT